MPNQLQIKHNTKQNQQNNSQFNNDDDDCIESNNNHFQYHNIENNNNNINLNNNISNHFTSINQQSNNNSRSKSKLPITKQSKFNQIAASIPNDDDIIESKHSTQPNTSRQHNNDNQSSNSNNNISTVESIQTTQSTSLTNSDIPIIEYSPRVLVHQQAISDDLKLLLRKYNCCHWIGLSTNERKSIALQLTQEHLINPQECKMKYLITTVIWEVKVCF